MISILICGKGGQGIETAGKLLLTLCTTSGRFVFGYSEVENSIHGGINTYQIIVSNEKINGLSSKIDIVLALDPDALKSNLKLLKKDCLIIQDADTPDRYESTMNDYQICNLEITRIAKKYSSNNILKNTVGVGALAYLLNISKQDQDTCIHDLLKNKTGEIINQNIQASHEGYDACAGLLDCTEYNLPNNQLKDLKLYSGTEVACKAAIEAECKFIAAYPMTPSSGIFHGMAKADDKEAIISIHAEDEIAAINMAIGASYTGTRAMTTTSGGGYALMTEAVGLAGMAEIPLVIIEVQRPGPATGLPTKTAQGDLRQVINAGQGHFPHVVLAPGTVEQVYEQVFNAFNYADILQCPVTILLDRYIAEQTLGTLPLNKHVKTIDRGEIFKYRKHEEFLRYLDAEDEKPIRSLPGQEYGMYIANSYEHEPHGFPTEEPEMIEQMNNRRLKKMDLMKRIIPETKFIGIENADNTIICWGSTLGVVQEALKSFSFKETINILHFININPLPPNIAELILNIKHPIAIENNAAGELCGWLAENTNLHIIDRILDVTGKPFHIEDLGSKINKFIE